MTDRAAVRAGDTGEADPSLAAAVEAWRADPRQSTLTGVLAVLPTARVFAGITATSTAEHLDAGTGLRAESSAEMALMTLVSGDERALPVFSSLAALRRWRLDARPVPVPGDQVAASALEQGATTLLLDLDVAVTGPDLATLAQGYAAVAGSSLAYRSTTTQLVAPADQPPAALLHALARALADEPVRAARLLDGPAGPVLGVVPEHPLSAAELAELARRLVVRLGPALPADGLDLAVVPAKGPGVVVPGRRRLLRRGR